ncbi:MAG: ATP synthase F1 subunit delta [Leptospiraceae bacterium]|nr:ATP synthase F1 subunit delta [Leptospiraceae bacterium]MCP5494603.1 ATP synthase F1 subunit delta [Leptospiraceae bacterium]
MSDVQIAKMYSRAILEIAVESNAIDSLESELKDTVDLFVKDDEIWNFLISPRIDRQIKASIIEQATKGRVSETLSSFLRVLIKNDRMLCLPEIYKQFYLGIDQLKGRIRASVYVASPLPSSEVEKLKAILSQKYNGECFIDVVVKPDVIGGLVIRIGDEIIDGSMQNYLYTIRQRLLETKQQSGAFYEN